jgi:hypothetical protein
MSNKKRTLTALFLVAGAVAVLAGGLMASNMGFKLNRQLLVTGTASNTNTLALPYNRQVGIDTAKDLFLDIGPANVQLVQKWNIATDSTQSYSYGSPDFPLAAGEGNFVKMNADTNYIVVGSHDPSATISLVAGVGSGTNLYAHPYHGVASTAKELFLEIDPTRVQLVQRWNPATDSTQSYTYGSPDFPLVPGEAYFLKMNTSYPYPPAHY